MVIAAVEPEVDGGRFAIKRVQGESVRVRASVFTEGHDRVAAVVRHRDAGEEAWREVPMRPLGNDRFEATFRVQALGDAEYTLEGWIDRFAGFRDALGKKAAAGQDVGLDLREGAALVRAAASRTEGADAAWLRQRAERLEAERPQAERVTEALAEDLAAVVTRHPDRSRAARHAVLRVQVERALARASAWYEFFPRSCAPEPGLHGTFRDAESRLEYAASLGFDIVYLPPIHPIGRTHRKGANNTPGAEPDDPGSPWAIGSDEGGHKDVHPALGTLQDFDRFVAKARALGMDVALDVAFQCAPDHPWVRKHPEWFHRRPDGSIHYAENPPKRYQDIFPLDFECEAWRELWDELLSVFLFWVGHGVTVFRVDNPHTKPFAFWEWVIREVRTRHPETIFLSEAFTRPSVMQTLAKLGFSQSYTYFTWRNTKWELERYLSELGTPPVSEFMRGNLWPNTPDILHAFLQADRRAAFQIRSALAATALGNWGIYGPAFELCEHRALDGSEEYLDSEKYQVRHWDVDSPRSIRAWIQRLNEVRRECVALTEGSGPRFLPVDNDEILAFWRTTEDLQEVAVVVVNLSPWHVHSGWVEVPLEAWGLSEHQPYQMHDLLGGARFLWHGRRNFVRLDPDSAPAHVFRVRRRVRTEQDFDYYL